MKDMVCSRCGSIFPSGSPCAKYCPPCKRIVKVETMRRNNAKRSAEDRRLTAKAGRIVFNTCIREDNANG